MKLARIKKYQGMMADDVRMRAYQTAISAVCPGKTICEIGVGLGPLSLMALQQGATRVFGIEHCGETLEWATKVIRAHGFGEDRFIPIQGLSTEVTLPARVDVLLSETLDSIGIGESTVAFMEDARERFLKPDGFFLPSHLTCYVALGSSNAFLDEIAFWGESLQKNYGLNYNLVAGHVASQRHVLDVPPNELSSQWQSWQHIDFKQPETFEASATTLHLIQKPGPIIGFCTAFEATLSDGVGIDTRSDQPTTHWRQSFSNLPKPFLANTGDLVALTLESIPGEDVTQWTLKKSAIHVPAPEVRNFLNALK